ncbi:hypothetical protein ACFWUZ_30455 [Streptomyces sp. NPDC058646]|uniref:hypothetical protein n=1 Tax=Streptomyces sp. NPDC058646 TaxID=3346574 RepID=UPI00365E4027
MGAKAHYRRGRDEHSGWHAAAQRNLFNRLLGQLYHCRAAEQDETDQAGGGTQGARRSPTARFSRQWNRCRKGSWNASHAVIDACGKHLSDITVRGKPAAHTLAVLPCRPCPGSAGTGFRRYDCLDGRPSLLKPRVAVHEAALPREEFTAMEPTKEQQAAREVFASGRDLALLNLIG